MSKHTFEILDGIYDNCLADVELELSDEQFTKLKSWIEENHADDHAFDISELYDVDEPFAEELSDIAYEYAKNDCFLTALSEAGEDQDKGMSMFLQDVKSGKFIPSGWNPNKPFTVKAAVNKDEYFEEWEDRQPKFGEPGYWEYIDERYDLYSMIDVSMIPYSVMFPEELFGKKAVCPN